MCEAGRYAFRDDDKQRTRFASAHKRRRSRGAVTEDPAPGEPVAPARSLRPAAAIASGAGLFRVCSPAKQDEPTAAYLPRPRRMTTCPRSISRGMRHAATGPRSIFRARGMRRPAREAFFYNPRGTLAARGFHFVGIDPLFDDRQVRHVELAVTVRVALLRCTLGMIRARCLVGFTLRGFVGYARMLNPSALQRIGASSYDFLNNHQTDGEGLIYLGISLGSAF